MATREAFLAELDRWVGTTEDPPGSNCQPFSKQLGRPCEYWCADYIAASAENVGLALPSASAYTPTMADAFRRAGRWSHTPEPGAIGFVDFPGDNHTGIQHVWVVEAVAAGLLRTVEGNTSSGEVGSQDNGGGVFRRTRPPAWVVGYGLPAFDTAPPTLGNGILLPDEEHEMAVVITRPQGGYIVVAHDGGVFAYDGAPFPDGGSIPAHPEWKVGGNVVGGAWTTSGEGYWLTTRDGAVYSFGDAVYAGGPDRPGAFNALPADVRGGRYVVGMVGLGQGHYRQITFDPHNDGSPYDVYEFAA